jgi:hypothetical protein
VHDVEDMVEEHEGASSELPVRAISFACGSTERRQDKVPIKELNSVPNHHLFVLAEELIELLFSFFLFRFFDIEPFVIEILGNHVAGDETNRGHGKGNRVNQS